MAKIFKEKSSNRYICKGTFTYKGVKFFCKGTSVHGKTEAKRAWERNVDKRCREIDGIEEKKAGKIKFSDAITEWYDRYVRGSATPRGRRSPKTIKTDEDTIRQLCGSELGSMYLCDIDRDTLQDYLNSLADRSDSTIKKRWNMLNMFYEYYEGKTNTMSGCSRPVSYKEKNPVKPALTDEEMERLAEQLRRPYNPHNLKGGGRGYFNGRILVVIMYEFLRYGEAVELRRKDVDLERGIIHVSRQYQDVANPAHPEEKGTIKSPKYDSAREVPIAKECRDMIEEACRGKADNDLLFPGGNLNESGHDGHILERNLLNTLCSACENCGIERQTVHDLRHSGISRLVRLGVKPVSIQRWAGHKDLNMTLRGYFRQTDTMDPDDVAIMCG